MVTKSAGGQEVGRINIRVVPELGDFQDDARKKLNQIEKRLNLKPIKIKAQFDATGLRQSIVRTVSEINKENKATAARKVRLYSELSTSGIVGQLKNARREYAKNAKALKPVQIRSELTAGEFEVEISKNSLARASEQLNNWRKDHNPIKFDVEVNMESGSMVAASTRMAYLSRPRTATIIPKVDEAAAAGVASTLAALSGFRLADSIFDSFFDFFKEIDKNLPLIGSLAEAIMGLGAFVLTAASNMFALAQSLAQIGPIALTLPGVFGGFALGLGASVAVLKDFNTVLPQVAPLFHSLQDAMSSNFWDQFKAPMEGIINTLFPAFSAGMQSISTQIGTWFAGLADGLGSSLEPLMGSMFSNLALSIQEFTAATPAIANIVAILGHLGASVMPGLASWAAQVAINFSDWLTKASDSGALMGWVEVAKQNLADLGSVLASLGGILAAIATAATEAGGSGLRMMAEQLASVRETVESASFQEGLVGVLRAAHQAMDNIANISGPAFTSLIDSIASGLQSVLPMVGRTLGMAMEGIFSALNQPAVADGAIALFAGLQTAIASIVASGSLDQLGAGLGALMSSLGNFASVMGPVISQLFTGLGQVMVALSPVIDVLVNALTGLLTGALGPLTTALVALAEGFAAMLADGGMTAITSIVQTLTTVFSTLLPIITTIVNQVFAALAPMLPLIAEAFNALATAVMTVLAALMPLIEPLLQLVTAILTPLLPLITSIAQMFGEVLGAAITALVAALGPFIEMLAKIIDFIMPILVPAIEFLASILIDTLASAFNGITNIIQGALDIVMGIWNTFSSLFQGDWEGVWNGIKQVASGIWDLIKGLFETLMNIGIFGVAKKILTSVKAFFKAAWSNIKDVAKMLWDDMKSNWNGFLTALKNAPSSVIYYLKQFLSNAWEAMKTAAQRLWGRMVDAIKSTFYKAVGFVTSIGGDIGSTLRTMWGDIKTVAKQAWDKIVTTVKNSFSKVKGKVTEIITGVKDLFANAGSWLIDAGKKIIQGLVDGIAGMFGAVKGKLGELTSKLTDWKGPAEKDRKLLTPAGKLIMNSLLVGFESQYARIRKSLQGFTNDIAGDVFGGSINAGFSGNVAHQVNGALASGGGGSKTFNYYAAAGSSLSSEDDLFAALHRGRAVGF